MRDLTWSTRLGPIGGSPEYNSGTSTFAGAASAVIELFYSDEDDDDGGDDDQTSVSFCFQTDLALIERCYASPLQAEEEAGRSRIFQGIHFQFSNIDGRNSGRAIGTEIATTRLRRIDPD